MNPTLIWRIARHEYLSNLRRPRFLIFTLVIPLLGLVSLIIGTFFSGQATDFLSAQFNPEIGALGLVDRDGRFTPVEGHYAAVIRLYPDQEAGIAALEGEQIAALYIIPADYLESGRITIVRAGQANAFDADTFTLTDYLRETLVEAAVDPAYAPRILEPVAATTEITLGGAAAGETTSSTFSFLSDFIVPYALGLLLVISIFSSSGFLLGSVAEEKSSRVVELLLSSVSAEELLTGKVLGLGALGLTRIAFWLACGALLGTGASRLLTISLSQLTDLPSLLLSVIYVTLGFLIFAFLMGAGGALGGSLQESQQVGGIFGWFAAAPLWIIGFIFSNPNAAIARVLSWFPLTAPTMMILRLSFGNVALIDIIGSLVVTTLTVPFVIWAGAKVFRAGLLNYGKRPNLKQVWKMIRG